MTHYATLPHIRRKALAKLAKREHTGYSYPVGGSPLQGMYRSICRNLATKEQWAALESAELVRLRIEPDDCVDFDDLCGDCFSHKANPDISPAKLDKQRAEYLDKVNRDGVWGIIGEYRISPDAEWQTADSCWGFVGDEWQDSGYDVDAMATTIDALRKALADRCPLCRK